MLKKILANSILPLICFFSLSAQEEIDQKISIPQITYFTVDFSESTIQTHSDEDIDIDVTVGPGTLYNGHYKNSWLMHYAGSSFIEIHFDNQWEPGPAAFLELCHLSSMVDPKNYSPITILVNDKVVASNHSPWSGNYIVESFSITECLSEGENIIRIDFDEDAISNYWIQNLKVKFNG